MSQEKSSYQQIFKATSIFGGVQIYNILLQLVRSKFVAVLLGPTGMGLMGLFNSTLTLVSTVTNLGLGASAVRNIAQANAKGNQEKISFTISLFRKLVWITGSLGLVVTFVSSYLLSNMTFGNETYTYAFAILSVTLLINQLAAGQRVVLQGMRKIKWMAQSNILGSSISVILTLPLYYFFGTDGIVPAIIATSIIAYLIQSFFSKKIKFTSVAISLFEAVSKGKDMIKLGVTLSISSLITILVSYLVRIYISNTGGLSEVGLYSAGFSIISGYVGLVFTAMGTDYSPRLAAVHEDSKQYNRVINQQSEVAIYILTPIICIFLIFINWIVIILYSTKFLAITGMIHWAIIGIFFKALSWSIGAVIMAKGNSKYFLWNELIANAYFLIFNVIGYYLFGLDGLGISFLIGYFVHFLQTYFFCKKKYGFEFTKENLLVLVICISAGISCFLINYFLKEVWSYILGSIVIIGVSFYSFYKINQKTNFLQSVQNKFKK